MQDEVSISTKKARLLIRWKRPTGHPGLRGSPGFSRPVRCDPQARLPSSPGQWRRFSGPQRGRQPCHRATNAKMTRNTLEACLGNHLEPQKLRGEQAVPAGMSLPRPVVILLVPQGRHCSSGKRGLPSTTQLMVGLGAHASHELSSRLELNISIF